MNTIIDTLKLFSDPDAMRPFERKPFLYKMENGAMAAVGTDGHRLILFNANQLINNPALPPLEELAEPNIENVLIKTGNYVDTIEADRLQKALAQVPIITTEKCCDCHSFGYVDYVFEAHDGEHYWKRLECPVCGGTGYVGVEDGEEDFDYTYGVRINGGNFLPKHLKPVADALTAMQIPELLFKHNKRRIQLENEQFVMVVMENMLEFEHIIDY